MSVVPRLMTALTALALCGVLASPATAQVSASIDATATVTNGFQVLTISGTQDLQFGTLDAQACTSTTGPCANVTDGRFEITGEPTQNVNVDFTLPTTLLGPGGDLLNVSFGATDGKVLTTGTTTVSSTFDPTVTQVVPIDGGGDLWIGIGGSATTRQDQTDGFYTGTITLTVSYL
ncbi:MAG: DUF4402 domain-containing protein [Gemmatimonadota bacterium]|nr:DUF4402 domain-containing protein [Gemmatimonadota bacterium]MDH4350165.1 DUF4402 domain-containing protein [Gemmatimonadota bacterium]MDH5196205.1 DUF4402 domain-containing protein [Gemmatimonadota bacterium]